MSHVQTLMGKLRRNLGQAGVRFISGTTSAAGAANGSYFEMAGIAGNNDAWNGMEAMLTSGTFVDEARFVEDFVASSGRFYFTNNPFPGQIASGTRFECYEKGSWAPAHLRSFLIDAAGWLLERLQPHELVNYELEVTKSGNIVGQHARCELPTGFIPYGGAYAPFTRPVRVADGDRGLILVSPDDWWFIEQDQDAGLLANAGDDLVRYVGYIGGRTDAADTASKLYYLPAISESFVFTVIPEPAFDNDGNWKLPEIHWDRLAAAATALALAANDLEEKAGYWWTIAGVEK